MITAVGLSGGVDSSVAAWLLKQQGFSVIGATMQLVPEQSETAVADARRVAQALGIPHYVLSLEKEYQEIILSYIESEYTQGRTPNPCVCCNRAIKFGLFLEKLESQLGHIDFFATGHFASIITDPETGRFTIRQGLSREKDQAYFLSLLSQEQLAKIQFPLGDKTKEEVREIARLAGLFTSSKKESQDLCVGEYRKWIKTGRPGDFITTEGTLLGKHRGIGNYTIGQRKGLGISHPEPLYVSRIEPERNRVILTTEENDLLTDTFTISQINWMGITEPQEATRFDRIKIRYSDDGEPGTLTTKLEDNRWIVRFNTPRRAVTPGQLAVLYKGDTVALAGIIERDGTV